jgi:hypothetical protein
VLDEIIFAFGVLVFVFFAGLIFTIKEMRKMGINPEKYRPRAVVHKAQSTAHG